MLCFQALLFLIELRHSDGFVSDCLFDDLGTFSFLMVVAASVMGQLFPELQREAIGSALKTFSWAVSGSKTFKDLG